MNIGSSMRKFFKFRKKPEKTGAGPPEKPPQAAPKKPTPWLPKLQPSQKIAEEKIRPGALKPHKAVESEITDQKKVELRKKGLELKAQGNYDEAIRMLIAGEHPLAAADIAAEHGMLRLAAETAELVLRRTKYKAYSQEQVPAIKDKLSKIADRIEREGHRDVAGRLRTRINEL